MNIPLHKTLKTIFILEDSDDLRELYTFIFDQDKYHLEMFATVAEFGKAADRTPDLYLLDIMLPDGDGISVCQQLQVRESSKKIPVLLVSAHQQHSVVKSKCPWASFIEKPFDIDHLEKAVAELLA